MIFRNKKLALYGIITILIFNNVASSQSHDVVQRISSIDYISGDDIKFTRRIFYLENQKIEKLLTNYYYNGILDYGMRLFAYSSEGKVEKIISSSINNYECALFSHEEDGIRVYMVKILQFDGTTNEFNYSIRADGEPFKEVFASLPPEMSEYIEFQYLTENYKHVKDEIVIYPELEREVDVFSKDEIKLMLKGKSIGKILIRKSRNFVIYEVEMDKEYGYASFSIRINYETGDSNYECIVR